MAAVTSASEPYQVTLDIFAGPLDLLLRLIERQELDITRVSLAIVADQYLAHIKGLDYLSSDNLAEFLVIAAKLLVIKSRSLLPPPAILAENEEDVGALLAQQLVEYKRFKQAAAGIRTLEQNGRHTFLRLAPAPHTTPTIKRGALTPQALLSSLRQALARNNETVMVDTVVYPVIVHISECIAAIKRLLEQQDMLPLGQVIENAQSRLEIVVLFLALLELIKQQQVTVRQGQPFEEIYIEPRQAESGSEVESTNPADYGEV